VERDVIRRRALTVFLACHFDGSAADLQAFLQTSPQPEGDQPATEAAAAATTA
jgi:hypothetical protein